MIGQVIAYLQTPSKTTCIIHVLPGFSPHGHNQLSARVTFAFHEDALHCSPYMVLVSAHCRDARPSVLSFLPSVRQMQLFPFPALLHSANAMVAVAAAVRSQPACLPAFGRWAIHPSAYLFFFLLRLPVHLPSLGVIGGLGSENTASPHCVKQSTGMSYTQTFGMA